MVHPSARLEDTIVRGPAIIGPGARLSHAYVGPYTSIGADVTDRGLADRALDRARPAPSCCNVGSRLETSVIGRGARISRKFVVPTAMRLSVGDGAEVTVT